MARKRDMLTARRVETVKEPGSYHDGAGLYLVVAEGGSKRWIFRYTSPTKRKRCEMGLGSANKGMVGLAEARERAQLARDQIKQRLDPIETRIAAPAPEPAAVPTFGDYADTWVDDNEHQFRNVKHVAQWRMTLREYAAPLRKKPVDDIATEDVLDALKPIWLEKPETAKRTQGRIERILDAAKAQGLRHGDNPARWRGHLSLLLPKQKKVARGHHAALPFRNVPAFVIDLRQREGTAARALEFLILTAARSGEVRGAVWSEFDLESKVWTVPADRMKAGREHRVPLTERATELLRHAKEEHGTAGYVFPGMRGQALSDMTLAAVLKRMKIENATVHGFRSSFRDWAGEVSPFPREVAEAALAHVVGDATERAYRRGDALEKRRKLMEAWAAFMAGTEGAAASNVVQLHEAAAG